MKKKFNFIIFGGGDRLLKILKSKEFKNLCKFYDLILDKSKNNRDLKSSIYFNKKKILKKNYDLGIVCNYSKIISEKILKIPNLGFINFHGGKIPSYRGGSPLVWQMINGEKKIFISAIKMAKGIDKGNLLAEKSFILKENYEIKDVLEKSNDLFPKLLDTAVKNILNNKSINITKRKEKYYHQRSISDSTLSVTNSSSNKINRFVKALQPPYPLLRIKTLDGEIFQLKKVKNFFDYINGTPGKIVFIEKKIFLVCKNGCLQIVSYKSNKNIKIKNNHYFV